MNRIEFDNHQAAEEGWVVSDCEGSDNGPWQLQKVDEMTVFGQDFDAWEFVWKLAENGSVYHQAALEFIKERNPVEWASIARNFAPMGSELWAWAVMTYEQVEACGGNPR